MIKVNAIGFRLPNQDPEAIARGNAFVATADNPSAIYYNPAGITQLKGQNISVGVYLVSSGIEYTSSTGASAETDSTFQPVPQLYYTMSLKDLPLSFGLGIYAPYGLSVDWGDTPPFRTRGQSGEMLYASFNPVIAWQIHPTLSIGVGPTINYSEVSFEQGILFPGDQFRFEGDDIDYGFNVGILWQPHEKWAFGASYRSSTDLNYKGSSETTPQVPPNGAPPVYFPSTSTSAAISFPQHIVFGVSFRPTKKWNLEFNADWTDWDTVNNIAFDGIPFPPVTLNYRSSWMYEFGVTRKFDSNYFVSAGYFFSENSSPDAGFHPLIPDSDLHLGSFGFGHKGSSWDWAVAYHFGYNSGRTVTGSQMSAIGETADGTYEVLNHAVNISASYRF